MQKENFKLRRRLSLLYITASKMITVSDIRLFITFPLIDSSMDEPQIMIDGRDRCSIIVIPDGWDWFKLNTTLPSVRKTYFCLRKVNKKYLGKLGVLLFIWSSILGGSQKIALGYVGMMLYVLFILPDILQLQIFLLTLTILIFTIISHYKRIRFDWVITFVIWIIMLITVSLTIFFGIIHFDPCVAFNFSDKWFNFSCVFPMGFGFPTWIAMCDLLSDYNICFVEEEVKNLGYVLPKAITLSVIEVTFIYSFMNVLMLVVLSRYDVASSTRIVYYILNNFAFIFTILLANTANVTIYSLMNYSSLPFLSTRDRFFLNGLNPFMLKNVYDLFDQDFTWLVLIDNNYWLSQLNFCKKDKNLFLVLALYNKVIVNVRAIKHNKIK